MFKRERLDDHTKELNLDSEDIKLLSISAVLNPTLGYTNTGG